MAFLQLHEKCGRGDAVHQLYDEMMQQFEGKEHLIDVQ